MFKRLMMGLLVAGLLVAWVAPEAEAVVSRWWRSLDALHIYPALYAADQYFGVRLDDASGNYVASCTMAGTVNCDIVVSYRPMLSGTKTANLNGETDFVA